MKKFEFSKARSLSNEGEFDYNNFLVRLNNLTNDDISLFDPILDADFDWSKWKISDYEYAVKSINSISTLVHEYTHFLDTTATSWGDQYTYRKLLVLESKCNNSDDLSRTIEVFQLNISEIKNLHSDLIKINNSNYNDMVTMNHAFDYTVDHGPLIHIIINYKDKSQDCIPISMLAVNEGHAFCNEMIFKFKLCNKVNDISLKNVLISIFKKDFEKFLNSTEQAEYNILLKLCYIHFKDNFSIEEILTITSIILGFSLDCDEILLTQLSHALDNNLHLNSFFAQALIHDMRRGHSRHFLAFKLIIITSNMYNSKDYNKTIIINISNNNNGRENLLKLITDAFNEIFSEFSLLKDIMIKNLTTTTQKYNNNYILKEISANRITYPLNSYIIENLDDYKTLSFLLSDDTIIKLQNSIDLDIENYYLEDLDDSFSILNDAYDNVKKFHMNPHEVDIFLNEVRQLYQSN